MAVEGEMKLQEFKTGKDFYLLHRDGYGHYRCTDKGTRVVVAICLDSHRDNSSWFNGPPYAVAECVIDEDTMEVCYEHKNIHGRDDSFPKANKILKRQYKNIEKEIVKKQKKEALEMAEKYRRKASAVRRTKFHKIWRIGKNGMTYRRMKMSERERHRQYCEFIRKAEFTEAYVNGKTIQSLLLNSAGKPCGWLDRLNPAGVIFISDTNAVRIKPEETK